MTNRPTKARNKKNTFSFQTQALIGGAFVVVIFLLLFLVTYLDKPTQANVTNAGSLAEMTFSGPPTMSIDVEKTYYAVFTMLKGDQFTAQLFPVKAPITVNNFVFLARQGFFDGVTFHRVLEGFMAQGGDRTGTGAGGPGYEFQNEDSDLTFDKPGVLAMANAGRDSNGSQFFITFVPVEYLNGDYTIFGQIVDGMEVVNNITLRDPNQNPTFSGDIIAKVEIIEQ